MFSISVEQLETRKSRRCTRAHWAQCRGKKMWHTAKYGYWCLAPDVPLQMHIGSRSPVQRLSCAEACIISVYIGRCERSVALKPRLASAAEWVGQIDPRALPEAAWEKKQQREMRESLRTVVNLAPNLSTCNLSKSNNDLREVNGRLFLLEQWGASSNTVFHSSAWGLTSQGF